MMTGLSPVDSDTVLAREPPPVVGPHPNIDNGGQNPRSWQASIYDDKEANDTPLAAGALAKYMEDSPMKPCVLAQKRRNNEITQSREDDVRVPGKIDYGTQCNGLCEETSTPLMLLLHKEMLRVWAVLLGPGVVKEDILFRVDVFVGGGNRPVTRCMYLCAANRRWGRQTAKQSWLMLRDARDETATNHREGCVTLEGCRC